MQPYLAANLSVLEELIADLTDLVAGLGSTELNWTPLPTGTNSIAVLVTHIAGSLDSWLARAANEPVSRDRDAEFRARATTSDLLVSLENALASIRLRFALLDEVDGSAVRRVRRLSRNEAADVSVSWCVEHAVIHAGEHWGQIQLTHQLYASNHAVRRTPPHMDDG